MNTTLEQLIADQPHFGCIAFFPSSIGKPPSTDNDNSIEYRVIHRSAMMNSTRDESISSVRLATRPTQGEHTVTRNGQPQKVIVEAFNGVNCDDGFNLLFQHDELTFAETLLHSMGSISELDQGLVLVVAPQESGKSITSAQLLNPTRCTISLDHPHAEAAHWSTPGLLSGLDAPSTLRVFRGFEQILFPEITNNSLLEQALMLSQSKLVIAQVVASDLISGCYNLLSLSPNQSLFCDRLSSVLRSIIEPRILFHTGKWHVYGGILNINRACQTAIIEQRFRKLPVIVNDDNAGPGSISIDKELAALIQDRKLNLEDASRYAQDPTTMKLRASGIVHN